MNNDRENIIISLELALFKLHPTAEALYNAINYLRTSQTAVVLPESFSINKNKKLMEFIVAFLSNTNKEYRPKEIEQAARKEFGNQMELHKVMSYCIRQLVNSGKIVKNKRGSAANMVSYKIASSE